MGHVSLEPGPHSCAVASPTVAQGRTVVHEMRAAGLDAVRVEELIEIDPPAVCVSGTRPG